MALHLSLSLVSTLYLATIVSGFARHQLQVVELVNWHITDEEKKQSEKDEFYLDYVGILDGNIVQIVNHKL